MNCRLSEITLLLLIILLQAATTVSGQSSADGGAIRGLVRDDRDQPLPGAAVMLLQAENQLLWKGELADDDGGFGFTGVPAGNYLLKIQYTGLADYQSDTLRLNGQTKMELPPIALTTAAETLNEVTVTARVPLIERKLDRIIVNIENSIVSTGGSALDALARSPGIVVNQDGGVSLKGRGGVIIMIDGKPSQLGANDLSTFLSSMPASSVSKIEIMANPSAKYDAAGNAGIVNIKMKKDQRLGANGGLNLAYGQGRFRKINAGLDFNYRTKHFNIFGNYNWALRTFFANLELYRRVSENGQLATIFDQTNYIIFPFNNHLPRLGADFFLGKNTTLGVVVNGIGNWFNPDGRNTALIMNPQEELVGSFSTVNDSRDFWHNYGANVNFKHTFDTLGRELTADLDYINYGNETRQLFNTDYFDAESLLIRQEALLNRLDRALSIRSAKVDYAHPLRNGHVLEAGAKSSWVESDTDLRFFDRTSGTDVLDPNRSNHFIYTENINAAYLNYRLETGKINWQFGLRAEQTLAEGLQTATDSSFQRDYFQLFPSLAATWNASEKHNFNLTLSRRINRPGYQQLNPFRIFIAPNTYQAGNPYLVPELAYSAELSHTLANKFTTTLSYGYTGQVITSVLIADSDNNVVQTTNNIAKTVYYGLGFSLSHELTSWWSTNTNLQLFYNRYTGIVTGAMLDEGRPSFGIYSNNALKIIKGLSGEVNFNYNYRQVYGVSIIEPMWELSAGLQKQIFRGRATLRLNVSDIFWTNFPSGYTGFGGVDEYFNAQRDTRVVTLGLNWRFGKNTVAPARRRTGGAQDEQQRVGTN